MKRHFLCLILIISKSAFSYSINEIKDLALERSSLLSAHEMETRALQSEAISKGKWQNPQMMGQLGSLKSGQTKGTTIEVSLTQAVPLSDKFSLRKEIAQAAMQNQQTQSEFFKNWVSHQASISAWRVFVNQELLNHGAARAKRMALVKKYLETRPRVSVKQRVELSLIASLLLQLEKMQDEKQHEFLAAKSDLEFWTGKKITAAELDLKIPDSYQFPFELILDISRDAELIQANNQLKISSLDRELAAKERRPDIYLGGGYRVENVEPVNHFSYGIIGLNIPLWDSGGYRAEAARARELRDQSNLEEMKRKTTLKHQQQLDLVNFDLQQIKRFSKKFIKINEATIDDAVKGFEKGVLDVNTFLQAETQSHEVIDQVFLSWMNYLENLSSLQLMRGERFSWEKN